MLISIYARRGHVRKNVLSTNTFFNNGETAKWRAENPYKMNFFGFKINRILNSWSSFNSINNFNVLLDRAHGNYILSNSFKNIL